MTSALTIACLWASQTVGLSHRQGSVSLDTISNGDDSNIGFPVDLKGCPPIKVMSIAMPDAQEYVREFFTEIGAGESAEVVPGVNRSSLNIDDLVKRGTVSRDYQPLGIVTHTPQAELATTFAHARAIRRFLDSDEEYGLIFEEDAAVNQQSLDMFISDGYKGVMQAVCSLVKYAPEGWSEINLGRCNDKCEDQSIQAHLVAGATLVRSPLPLCSAAYLINRNGARILDYHFNHQVRFAGDSTRVVLQLQSKYNITSVTPRLFKQRGRCGVNGCANSPECTNWGLESNSARLATSSIYPT